MGTSNRNAACIAAKKVEPYLKGTNSLNRGFVEEFEPLVKWTSGFSNPAIVGKSIFQNQLVYTDFNML